MNPKPKARSRWATEIFCSFSSRVNTIVCWILFTHNPIAELVLSKYNSSNFRDLYLTRKVYQLARKGPRIH
jgi:hypothetical protein